MSVPSTRLAPPGDSAGRDAERIVGLILALPDRHQRRVAEILAVGSDAEVKTLFAALEFDLAGGAF